MSSILRLARSRGLRTLAREFTLVRANSTTSPLTSSTDACGIPTSPVWSVNELLSSYPSPQLLDGTIQKLYKLSALIPPEINTTEYDKVKKNLEEMVRLVEAVKLVDTTGVVVAGRREKEDADRQQSHSDVEEGSGQELLKYSERTRDGFYIVDAERKRS
ncbi:hypothetical protein CPB83DRAFT_843228 [Crepidotus variabilis]|uniref:Uncharacterized protein n=1 Tax=Crepidotus variabilis TaxID=179855 RepID=A0A9P6ERV1_9AGAR|nr:hypothetical protein CPB83DRAFT_843228 [Crepidotus variabilis]